MSRLHKKCFLASTGLHLLLLAILFVGPAFHSSRNAVDSLPVLDFIPLKTVDDLVSGGGNPDARPPAANFAAPPPQPAPAPPEPKAVTAPPKPEPAPEPEPDHFSDRPQKKPQVNLKEVIRNSSTSSAEKKAREREQALERQRREKLVRAVGNVADKISASGSTTIELRGPGGGGVPYANFLQAVKSVYTRAWDLPEGVTDNDATVDAEVTIARSGNVVSAHISRKSGNAAVDDSVRVTLERVRYAAPLPDNARENERTVTIKFNVRARRQLG